MVELLNLEIDELNLKFMIESNPNIKEMDNEEVLDRINLLRELRCNDSQISNILIGNPWYLDRGINDVLKLNKKLEHLGFERIDLMYDSNPFLLNIDDFINSKLSENYDMDDILDMIEENSNVLVE